MRYIHSIKQKLYEIFKTNVIKIKSNTVSGIVFNKKTKKSIKSFQNLKKQNGFINWALI